MCLVKRKKPTLVHKWDHLLTDPNNKTDSYEAQQLQGAVQMVAVKVSMQWGVKSEAWVERTSFWKRPDGWRVSPSQAKSLSVSLKGWTARWVEAAPWGDAPCIVLCAQHVQTFSAASYSCSVAHTMALTSWLQRETYCTWAETVISFFFMYFKYIYSPFCILTIQLMHAHRYVSQMFN